MIRQLKFQTNIISLPFITGNIVALLFCLLVILFFSFAHFVSAQDEIGNNNRVNISKNIREQIKQIENSIIVGEEQKKKLQEKIEKIAKDKMQQTAALIASAQRVKLAEIEVNALEENLAQLLAQKTAIEKKLTGTNKDIANLLAALQRLGRSPAPALLVEPSDALKSARSAILISAILPQLREEALIISKDLQQLNQVRQAALDEEEKFRANLEILAQEKLQTALLIEAREKEIAKLEQQIKQQSEQQSELKEKVKSLEEMLKNLSEQNNEQDLQANNPLAQMPDSTPKEIALAYADLSRTKPAIPFDRAKGYLAMPAAGVIVSKFGQNDGMGGVSKGISIVTRAQAQIIAPNDGWVIYQGEYLDYGQIVIINSGNDYTILLAGLEKTYVKDGQFILRGEPIGEMGTRTIGQAVRTGAGTNRPTLYVELRKNDIPLDPEGWWGDKQPNNQTG